MTLFNIRLGYWVPNPGRLAVLWARRILALPTERQEAEIKGLAERFEADTSTVREKLKFLSEEVDNAEESTGKRRSPGLTFEEVLFPRIQATYGTDDLPCFCITLESTAYVKNEAT